MNNIFQDTKVLILTDDYYGTIKQSFEKHGVNVYIASRKIISDLTVMNCTFTGDNVSAIVKALEADSFHPDMIFTSAERYVKIKSLLSRYYSIPALSADLVNRVIDKSEMRRIISQNDPSLSPMFSVVNSEEEIKEFINAYGLPVILKPTSLLKSLYVTKATTLDEAMAAFTLIKKRSKAHELSGKSGNSSEQKIIIEEFMTGRKYSVEGVVDQKGIAVFPRTVTDTYFGYDNVEMNDPACYVTIVPSSEKKEVQEEIFNATQRVVTALNLSNCPIHAEMIATKNGIKLIEIAARIGGFREVLYDLSFGFSLIGADFQIQSGVPACEINIDVTNISNSAIVKVYSYTEGVLTSLCNEDIITSLNSYSSHVRKAKDGQLVGPSKLGYTEIINVVLNHENRRTLCNDKDTILNHVTPVIKSKV